MAEIIIPNSSISVPKYSLKSPNTGVIRSGGGAARPMRNVTRAAGKGAGNLARAAKVAVVGQTVYDVGRLALSKKAREEEADRVIQMAEKSGAGSRFVTGLLDPVNTAYGIGQLIGDTAQAERDAAEATAAAPSDEQLNAAYLKNKQKREQEKSLLEAVEQRIAGEKDALEMQRANRRMADESNKSMNAAAAERPKASEKKATKMVNPLDKVQEGLKMEPTIFPKSGSLSDMARAPVSEMMKAPSPNAAEVPSRDFDALFKKATGTSFDPKSRVDRARMAELQGLISSRADLADKSDTKVALAWYASKKK